LRDHRSHLRPLPAVTTLRRVSAWYRPSPDGARFQLTGWADGTALQGVSVSGVYRPEERRVVAEIGVRGASLPHWQRYFRAVRSLPAVSGVADANATLHWKRGERPRVTGVVACRGAAATPRMLYRPLVADALRLRFQNNHLHLTATGTCGDTRAKVEGEIVLRPGGGNMDLQVHAPRVTLAGLQQSVRGVPRLRGLTWDAPATVTARLHGHPRHWQVDADARLRGGSANGVPFTNVCALVVYRRDTRRAEVHRLTARVAGAAVSAHGFIDYREPPARLSFWGEALELKVAECPSPIPLPRDGKASLRFGVTGTVRSVQVRAEAHASTLAVGAARLARLHAHVDYHTGGVAAVRARVGEIRLETTAAAWLPRAHSATATFHIDPQGVRIARGEVCFPGTSAAVCGSVSRSGALDLVLDAPRLPVALFQGALPPHMAA
ncbi:MAG: hypothetical protein QHJ73_19365, partial [Armatimonadota bacterium]|nr:hypothetical protein [Armatimonadota bacterium]